MIARTWRGSVATADADAYAEYMLHTGIAGYAKAAGNRGAWMLRRELDDGTTEFLMFTLWVSMEAVRAFAGPRPERAVFYPEDERFLLARELAASHYEVAAHVPSPQDQARLSPPAEADDRPGGQE